MKKLTNYFNNKLTEEENDKLTRVLLKKAFDENLKEKWAGILEKDYNVSPPSKKNAKRISLFWKTGAVAASVLLLVIVGKIYQSFSSTEVIANLNTEQLVDLHLANRFEHPNLKKSMVEEDIQAKAIEAYTKKDYPAAINFYNQIPTSSGE